MSADRVVVIGDALIDELRDPRGVREFIGGAALNVAVGLSVLGVPTTLIAMVGDDEPGERIRELLDAYRVELLASPSSLGTARAVSERGPSGEPVYAFSEAARQRMIRYGEAERAAIGAAPITVVSCVAFDDEEQTNELTDAVGGTPTRLVIDPNPRAGMMHDRERFIAGFEALVPAAALVKIGDDDARLLYRASLPEMRDRMLDLGAAAVLSTAGADGARVDSAGLSVARGISSLPGHIVDTMGAGDATLATMVRALLLESARDATGWEQALAEAMDVAAATCRAEGALLRLPRANEGDEAHRIDT
ncbi:PfkB family carbohydrate kinase [Microbacterium sp. ZW T5_56]|uniref:PfkB family carbohydrate kinase n=1 Tax=Microbacterium sp. ZW T5_56 TaxID=3378081 RepID=UPI00385452A8